MQTQKLLGWLSVILFKALGMSYLAPQRESPRTSCHGTYRKVLNRTKDIPIPVKQEPHAKGVCRAQ